MNKALLSLSGMTAKALAELMAEHGVLTPGGKAISARMISARVTKPDAPLICDESGLFTLMRGLPTDHPMQQNIDNISELLSLFDDRPKGVVMDAETGFGTEENVPEVPDELDPDLVLDDTPLDLPDDGGLDLSDDGGLDLSDDGGLDLSDDDGLDLSDDAEEVSLDLSDTPNDDTDLGLGEFNPEAIIAEAPAEVEPPKNPPEEDLPVYEVGEGKMPDDAEDDGLDLSFLN